MSFGPNFLYWAPAVAAATTGSNIGAGPTGPISAISFSGGSGYTAGTYTVPLTGGTGTGASVTAILPLGPGGIAMATLASAGTGYTAGDVLTPAAAFGGGTGFSVTVTTIVSAGFNNTLSGIPTLIVDGYTPVVGDRILVKDQTSALQNGIYTVTAVGALASGVGPVATTGSLVAGSGFLSGTYTKVQLLGGTGTGAYATVVVSGPGVIKNLGAVVAGSGYTPGSYSAVALTGGTGSGATANVYVNAAGQVQVVTLVSAGTGYTPNDSLTASTFGNGTGFTVKVSNVIAPITSITVTTPGVGYTANDVLTVNNAYTGGVGTGGSVTVQTVVPSNWVMTRAGSSLAGVAVFVGGGSTNATTAWAQTAFPVVLDTTPLTFVKFIN